jgi:hypothetical protein
MATWYKIGRAPVEVRPANGKKFTLAEMQKLVGGYVERVQLTKRRWLWCDEEGRLKFAPMENIAATNFVRENGTKLTRNTLIVGDAVVCEPGEF